MSKREIVLRRVGSALSWLHGADDRKARVARSALILLAFTTVSVVLRGDFINNHSFLNPDEVEILAQGRAARHSPVPFTTWVTATTGPIWPLFLALLSLLGLPLTVAFGHLLASVLYGVLAAMSYFLMRGALGPYLAAVVAAFVWVPLELSLTGPFIHFAALETSLLPTVFVLGAALIRPDALARRPWLYAVSGLLAGLGVGAKYQALPLAAIVLVVHLVLVGETRPKVIARRAGVWVLGAALPFVILGAAMLLSSHTSWAAISDSLDFLSSYGAETGTKQRLKNTFNVVTTDHVILVGVLFAWLTLRSTLRMALLRIAVAIAGVAAVLFGGMAFDHYLMFVYGAFAIAIGLPLPPHVTLLPASYDRLRRAALVAGVALVSWMLSFGATYGTLMVTTPRIFAAALDADNVPRDPRLSAACPPGSDVVVWGWASELYVYYSWRNAIPVFNTLMWTYTSDPDGSGEAIVQSAIEDPRTDCVVDAAGSPFWGTLPNLTRYYPAVAAPLDRDYRRVTGLLDCERCGVYVREVPATS